MVKKSIKYVFEYNLIPKVPGGRAASYELCPLFAYSIDYWDVYRRFQGDLFWWGRGLGEGSYMGGSFHGGIFIEEGKRVPDFPALFKNNQELNK